MTTLLHRIVARHLASESKAFPVDPDKVTKWLTEKNDPTEGEASRALYGRHAVWTFEVVPIGNIRLPAVWGEGKLPPLKEALEEGRTIDPVLLHDQGGLFEIADGIHRTNLSLEYGFTHIPAYVERWI